MAMRSTFGTIDATELIESISIDRAVLPRPVGPLVDVFYHFSSTVRAYAYYAYIFWPWRNFHPATEPWLTELN